MKNLRIISAILVLFVSLNALAGGALLIKDPSGALLGISIEQLEPATFNDFLIPGIILFFLNGLLGMLTGLFALFKRNGYPELLILQGIILFTWMFVQLFVFEQLDYLQYVVLVIGLALLAFGIRLRQLLIKREQ